jgi:hypothetical protein
MRGYIFCTFFSTNLEVAETPFHKFDGALTSSDLVLIHELSGVLICLSSDVVSYRYASIYPTSPSSSQNLFTWRYLNLRRGLASTANSNFTSSIANSENKI